MNSKDNLYVQKQNLISDFIFDESVAQVFDDMITRSVPGYAAIINMIGVLAKQYAKAQSCCYDLGCSLGSASRSILNNIDVKEVEVIAVDNSEAMIERCRTNVPQAKVVCADIKDVEIKNASVVTLNFTLQFFTPTQRMEIIQRISDGMNDGGVLILSEKIDFEDKEEALRQENLHHAFKKMNGYSDLEIAQKRASLEKVLIPDTLPTHQKRLKTAGFKTVDVWFQCFNFMSLIALK